MQVSRSPTARWTSAAATAESTPPDSAQMTSPSEPVSRAWASTRSRMSATVVSMKLPAVQVGATPGDADHEVAQDVAAARRVDDLGMELDAVQVARRRRPGRRTAWSRSGPWRGSPRAGARSSRRGSSRPAARARCRRTAASSRGDADVGRAVLAVVERDDVATELVGHQLGAVADAEDGDPPGPDRRVGPRGARVVDRVRAARQDDRPGAAPLELGVRRVVRQQLRVDVELADAPRDELGELAAEVEDDDGLAVVGGRPRRGDPRASGRGPAP